MKRSIINVLVLGLFLATVFIIGTNNSWACKSVNMQIMTSDEDPNEPAPEPTPEIVPADKQIIYLADDPNEPNEPDAQEPE